MKCIITGTGRSGTGYMSELLNSCGVKCGHESVFHARTALLDEPPDWQDYQADSSWMAVASLPVDAKVILVLRHPLDVVKSFMDIGFFNQDLTAYALILRHTPSFYEKTLPNKALAHWCYWNYRASLYADLIVRIESFEIQDVLEALDIEKQTPDHLIDARFNNKDSYKQDSWEKTWSDFRPGLKQSALQLAKQWGYDG